MEEDGGIVRPVHDPQFPEEDAEVDDDHDQIMGEESPRSEVIGISPQSNDERRRIPLHHSASKHCCDDNGAQMTAQVPVMYPVLSRERVRNDKRKYAG